MSKNKIKKEAIKLYKNELTTLLQEVRPFMKTAAANNLSLDILHVDKLNVLDRVKRDLMKFKAVGEETKGKKISKVELKTILKEKRLDEEKERIKNLKPKEKQTFYVTGKFTVKTKYNYSTKSVYRRRNI